MSANLTNTLHAVGGLGIFLLGMSLMTQALRSLAGASIRRTLMRFTRSPTSGAITGALVTMMIQSSSATTVTAVGFVGAGLISFADSLGIIFGANIGTTITGWLVALFGFKLQLSSLLLPVILVGSLLRLFGRGRAPHIGSAIAGFGLIFVGISFLQVGLSAFSDVVTPSAFPGDDLFGRLKLVAIGVAITVVTQSSSAGVATALTAVSVGSILPSQAMAMVIGMDLGTAATAALAAIGGNASMRRTGFAHVIFNTMTAILAIALLTPYLVAAEAVYGSDIAVREPELTLVGFHTLFNGLGVFLVLPFTRQFGQLVERLVTIRSSGFSRRLEKNLLGDADSALNAVLGTLRELTSQVVALVRDAVSASDESVSSRDELHDALLEVHRYADRIYVGSDMGTTYERYLSAVQVIDHLHRILERVGQRARLATVADCEELRTLAGKLAPAAEDIRAWLLDQSTNPSKALQDLFDDMEKETKVDFRRRTIAAAGANQVDAEEALQRLDGFRWLSRLAYHLWRIVHHLDRMGSEKLLSPRSQPTEPVPEE